MAKWFSHSLPNAEVRQGCHFNRYKRHNSSYFFAIWFKVQHIGGIFLYLKQQHFKNIYQFLLVKRSRGTSFTRMPNMPNSPGLADKSPCILARLLSVSKRSGHSLNFKEPLPSSCLSSLKTNTLTYFSTCTTQCQCSLCCLQSNGPHPPHSCLYCLIILISTSHLILHPAQSTCMVCEKKIQNTCCNV